MTHASTPHTTTQAPSPNQAVAADPQAPLVGVIQALTALVGQLAAQLCGPAATTSTPPAAPTVRPNTADSGPWDALSVVELRALLRSYPIDRSSLPAPIELLRRGELMEALSQLQSLGA